MLIIEHIHQHTYRFHCLCCVVQNILSRIDFLQNNLHSALEQKKLLYFIVFLTIGYAQKSITILHES